MTPSPTHIGSNPGILEILKERFEHDGFLPLQEEIIMNVLAGSDSLVLMPTGSGKSMCYQLPALLLDGLTLVKGGGILGHGVEQKCTSRSSVFSENVRLRRVLSGALSGSEVGGV